MPIDYAYCMVLPTDHRPYTDKYFLRTNEILKKESINSEVSIKVFARGSGKIAGLREAIDVFKKFSNNYRLWVTKNKEFKDKEPLLVIKAPIQDIVELETLYLGILSHELTIANGLPEPDTEKIRQKLQRLKAIYRHIPITYFGARHYHWKFDKAIAQAALQGGAKQTSTDIGSSNIGEEGVGTTPHILVIVLASIYGKEHATLKTAQLFDKHMDRDIPRITLVDTFNRELIDSLWVADYFKARYNMFRVDTCEEMVGEGGTKKKNSCLTGPGVTVELIKNIRNTMINNGYAKSTATFLSSGFGNEEKAKLFMQAYDDYKKETGTELFAGVGIGEVHEGICCTADVYEVDNEPIAKSGRECTVDLSGMKEVK